MHQLLTDDSNLSQHFDFIPFEFDTSRIGFQHFAGIEEIALQLRTDLYLLANKYKQIFLVSHSMGGLVVKKYLVNQAIEKRPNDQCCIGGAIFYATPHTGSDFAKLGSLFNPASEQIKQLKTNSSFLNDLSMYWRQLEITKKVRCVYVTGTRDIYVKINAGADNFDIIPMVLNKDHFDITVPSDRDDASYTILVDFLSPIIKKKYHYEISWMNYSK